MLLRTLCIPAAQGSRRFEGGSNRNRPRASRRSRLASSFSSRPDATALSSWKSSRVSKTRPFSAANSSTLSSWPFSRGCLVLGFRSRNWLAMYHFASGRSPVSRVNSDSKRPILSRSVVEAPFPYPFTSQMACQPPSDTRRSSRFSLAPVASISRTMNPSRTSASYTAVTSEVPVPVKRSRSAPWAAACATPSLLSASSRFACISAIACCIADRNEPTSSWALSSPVVIHRGSDVHSGSDGKVSGADLAHSRKAANAHGVRSLIARGRYKQSKGPIGGRYRIARATPSRSVIRGIT